MAIYINELNFDTSKQFVLTEWHDNFFKGSFLYDSSAWIFDVPYLMLNMYYDELKLSMEEYTERLRNILTGVNTSSVSVLKGNRLTVYEILEQTKSIRRIVIELELEQTDYNKAVRCFIENCIKKTADIEEQWQLCLSQSEVFITENKHLKVTLAESETKQKERETKLLQSFLSLLNAKKDRIAQLYEIIEYEMKQHVCNCANTAKTKSITTHTSETQTDAIQFPCDKRKQERLARLQAPSTSTGGFTSVPKKMPSSFSSDELDSQEIIAPILPVREPVNLISAKAARSPANPDQLSSPEMPSLDFNADDYLAALQ